MDYESEKKKTVRERWREEHDRKGSKKRDREGKVERKRGDGRKGDAGRVRELNDRAKEAIWDRRGEQGW